VNKKKACIICGEEVKKGSEVVEDKIIEIIRKIKGKFGAVKGYKLLVCENCIEKYEKRRKRFERNVIIYGGLGVVMALFLIVFNFSFASILTGIFLILVMILLALMGYQPRIKKKEEVKKNERKKTTTKRRSKKR
jgi:uncharacterized protein YacL